MAFIEYQTSHVVPAAGVNILQRSVDAVGGVDAYLTSGQSYVGWYCLPPTLGVIQLRFELRTQTTTSIPQFQFYGSGGVSGTVFYYATDLDGGSYTGSALNAPVGQAVWQPTFNVTGNHLELLAGIVPGGDPTAFKLLDAVSTIPAPSGAKRRGWKVGLGTTTASVPQAVQMTDGPWLSSETAGKTFAAYTPLDAAVSTVTVPIIATGGNLTVRATSTAAISLVSLGGATDNGDGSITVPGATRCYPAWSASNDLTLAMTKASAGQYRVSYSPFYVDTPPPLPTITKLIPTSGPDTGGTLVDIVGGDLGGATGVDFGGTAGTGLTVNPSGGLATVTTPAHTAGPAPVTITTPAGVSNAETFTFEAPPVVTVPAIYGAAPVSLCADAAPDSEQVLIPAIYPATDVVSAEVGGVNAGVVGVLDVGGGGFVVIFPPSFPPGTYDLVLTNSAGSSDPYPVEYVDCEGCPPDPTVVAVFPGAARPGATIQIVGTNLTDATVTMCGDPVAIVSNDGTIITVVVPPGCPDGPATITVTTPDGETTVEFTVLPPEPVPPADVSPRSWQIAQALLDAAFLCGAECARAFVTTDATPEGPPPGGCPCQLTATIVKDGYKTADGRRLVRSATIKLSLHQCTPIPQADEIPDPDTESDYALRQAETRDQMLRGLATARRQPSSVLGRCQTKQASEGWVHVSTTGGMSLYTMEVTVD